MRLFDGRNRRRGALPEHVTIPARVECLAQIPECRAARGKQHPLLALPPLICVAMLCGARPQAAIAGWGRPRRLGFTANRAPRPPTLSRLSQRRPHRTVGAALGRRAERARRRCPPAAAALGGIASAGATLRGSRRQGAARDSLLARVPGGRVVTADALLTQRDLARAILASGGDYPMAVRESRPALPEEAVGAFAPAVAGPGRDSSPPPRSSPSTAPGRGRGKRPGWGATPCAGGPAAAGARKTACAVTPVGPGRATPAQLPALWRGHRSVANQLHSTRGGACDEDRATVRGGRAPQATAAFRHAASGLIRRLGTARSTATCRRFLAQPRAALRALGTHPDPE